MEDRVYKETVFNAEQSAIRSLQFIILHGSYLSVELKERCKATLDELQKDVNVMLEYSMTLSSK